MALIKHAQSDVYARGAVVLDLGDIARQAESLKARAELEASRIVKDANAERDRLISDAAEQGFERGREDGSDSGRRAGFEQGRAEAFQEHGELLEQIEKGWSGALGEFETRRRRMLAQAQTDVVSLAVKIARLVTRRAVELDAGAAEEQLRAALSHALSATRLLIRVHPDDLELIASAMPRLSASVARSPDFEIIPDGSLTRGDCVVRTGAGEIDARIDTQLDRIAEALLPTRPAGEAPDPGDESGPES